MLLQLQLPYVWLAWKGKGLQQVQISFLLGIELLKSTLYIPTCMEIGQTFKIIVFVLLHYYCIMYIDNDKIIHIPG